MSTPIGTLSLAFMGPTEIIVVGVVAMVIIFGSRAPDVAQRIGKAFGNFQQSRQEVEAEVQEVKSEVGEEVQEVKDDVGLDEDIEEIRSDIEEINRDLEATTSTSTTPSESVPEEETNVN